MDDDWRLFVEGGMDEGQPGVPYDDLWPILWRQKDKYESTKEAWLNFEGKYARRMLVSLLAGKHAERKHNALET